MTTEISERGRGLVEAFRDAAINAHGLLMVHRGQSYRALAAYVAALEAVAESARPIVNAHQGWRGDHGDGCDKCVMRRALAALDAVKP